MLVMVCGSVAAGPAYSRSSCSPDLQAGPLLTTCRSALHQGKALCAPLQQTKLSLTHRSCLPCSAAQRPWRAAPAAAQVLQPTHTWPSSC